MEAKDIETLLLLLLLLLVVVVVVLVAYKRISC
jgi:hypothetical protein